MSTTSKARGRHAPTFSVPRASRALALLAFALLGAGAARAQQPPVVLVPVVTDPTDAPRLILLAKVLRTALADRGVSTVAARYTATLEDAKASGDAFAAALDLSGEFATLRYDLYSDELVRAHSLRLMDLAKAHTALLLAAPMANRVVLKRISKADGQSIALPDPCEPELAQQALVELLPPDNAEPPASPPLERTVLSSRTRKWLLGAGGVGLGSTALTVGLAVKRRNGGAQFQNSAPSDSGYLALGDNWRAPRAAMLASAAVAATSLSLAGVLFASQEEPRKLRWVSVTAAALGLATLAWAASDVAHGSPCTPNSDSTCVRAQSQLDRGILLAMTCTPFLAVATTGLSRWIHEKIRLNMDAGPHAASVSLAYLR